jgi:hypothetical protein
METKIKEAHLPACSRFLFGTLQTTFAVVLMMLLLVQVASARDAATL